MVTQTKTAAKEQAASAPIDPGVRIGHVHLKVADLDRAWRSTAACSVFS